MNNRRNSKPATEQAVCLKRRPYKNGAYVTFYNVPHPPTVPADIESTYGEVQHGKLMEWLLKEGWRLVGAGVYPDQSGEWWFSETANPET